MLRRERSLSQMELAERAGVSSRHVSFLETGRSQPTPAMIRRLAAALHLAPVQQDELCEAAGYAPHAAGGLQPRPVACGAVSADWLLKGVLEVQAAPNAEHMVGAAESLLAPFGVDSFFCVTLMRGRGPAFQSIRSRSGRFPAEWLEYYGRQSYDALDPLRQEAGRSHKSFFWSDLPLRMGGLRPEQRRVLMDARDYGITNGFVCPLHLGDGRVRGVSMMGREIDHTDPMVRLALQMIGGALLEGWEAFEPARPS